MYARRGDCILDKEITAYRSEIKYVVPIEKAVYIKECLDNLLQRDSYCINGAYSVRSVYFESIGDNDFFDKLAGVNIRKKVRIRTYNNDKTLCKLEIKQKYGELQQKDSLIINAEDADGLLHGNFDVLKNYFDDTATSIRAYSIMRQGCYRPAVNIEYDRLAYKYPMYDTSVTLDMNVRSSETNMDIFSRSINFVPIMPESIVLEVKFNKKLIGFVSDALEQFGLTQESYSKYCCGRKVYYASVY